MPAGVNPAANPARVSCISKCRLPADRLSEMPKTPGTVAREAFNSVAAFLSTWVSGCFRAYDTAGLAFTRALWNSTFSSSEVSPTFRRQTRSISLGDAVRTGRGLRWTRTVATLLRLAPMSAVRIAERLPAMTATVLIDVPSSWSLMERAASAKRSAAARVCSNGAPAGKCRSA